VLTLAAARPARGAEGSNGRRPFVPEAGKDGEKNSKKSYIIFYLATWREKWREKPLHAVGKKDEAHASGGRLVFARSGTDARASGEPCSHELSRARRRKTKSRL